MQNLCECGCGEATTPGRLFISGHNMRGKTRKQRITKTCKHCQNPFTGTEAAIGKRTYCCTECRDEHRRSLRGSADHPKRSRVIVPCATCGTPVETTPYAAQARPVYCSKECGKQGKRKKLETIDFAATHWRSVARKTYGRLCAFCGFEFFVENHHIIHKAKGGTDDIENLIPLCPNHHHMAHGGAYTEAQLYEFQKAAKDAELKRREASPLRLGRVRAKHAALAKLKQSHD